jgi:hypothetical protein
VEPVRGPLGPERFERLVSALAVVLGWEATIVLRDVRGLDAEAERATTRYAAQALLAAALASPGGPAASAPAPATPRRRR